MSVEGLLGLRRAEFITEELGSSGLSLPHGAAQMVGGGTTPLRQRLQSCGQHLASTKRLEWEPGPRWYPGGGHTWQARQEPEKGPRAIVLPSAADPRGPLGPRQSP